MPPHVDLTNAELAEISSLAKELGVTPEQAASMAVSAGLADRYSLRTKPGIVIPFQRNQLLRNGFSTTEKKKGV